MKPSRTTCRIFARSQRHENYEPDYYRFEKVSLSQEALEFLKGFYENLAAIKPHQTVTRRYILDNQYWEKSE